ncbi:MAG: general secretion pathway protein GspB [Pseudomonadales bacterium]
MSLLLEALQRADSERKDQADVPGIDTQHSVAVNSEPGNSRPWMLLALGLIILLLLAYVIYLQSPGPNSETAAATGDELSVQSNHADQVRQPNASTEEEAATASAKPTPNFEGRSETKSTKADIAALYERLKAENAADTRTMNPSEEVVATQPLPEIEERFVEETNEQDAVIDQQNAAEEVYSSIPFASQLPNQQQNSIPSLRYTTHGYAEATGKGMVTLNGRTQRRGDTITAGLVLLDIRADYIVLDMNGVLFRLPAATDWN